MFCPKCSQQQVSDETRFCSRCGFQLSVVKALLVNDDLPQNEETQQPSAAAADRSLRKRDLTIGAALMFVFAFIAAALTGSFPPSHSGRIILLVIAWLLLSLLINIKPLINYLFYGDASSSTRKAPASEISSGPASSRVENKMPNSALPAAQAVTAAADLVMPRRRHTAEIVSPPPPPPPSVTEPTTNLLDNKQN